MTFDIRGINGDIEFAPTGDFQQVVDSDKLAQDIVKLLNTPIGTNPFDLGYGSPLTTAQIGNSIPDVDSLIDDTKNTISQALEQLIALQALQSSVQTLSDAETIIDFETPVVEQDSQDPRQFNIAVNAIAKDLTPLTIALVVRY